MKRRKNSVRKNLWRKIEEKSFWVVFVGQKTLVCLSCTHSWTSSNRWITNHGFFLSQTHPLGQECTQMLHNLRGEFCVRREGLFDEREDFFPGQSRLWWCTGWNPDAGDYRPFLLQFFPVTHHCFPPTSTLLFFLNCPCGDFREMFLRFSAIGNYCWAWKKCSYSMEQTENRTQSDNPVLPGAWFLSCIPLSIIIVAGKLWKIIIIPITWSIFQIIGNFANFPIFFRRLIGIYFK